MRNFNLKKGKIAESNMKSSACQFCVYHMSTHTYLNYGCNMHKPPSKEKHGFGYVLRIPISMVNLVKNGALLFNSQYNFCLNI